MPWKTESVNTDNRLNIALIYLDFSDYWVLWYINLFWLSILVSSFYHLKRN